MRNDARPIGHDVADESPIANDDPRDSVAHQRESHVVNKRAAEDAQRDDADVDPVMPTGDSTLKTNI
jgi:hypothetical protein